MNLPTNPDFYFKLVIAVVVIIGAIYLQASTGNIPVWLTVAVAGILNFLFGVTTQPQPPDDSGGK